METLYKYRFKVFCQRVDVRDLQAKGYFDFGYYLEKQFLSSYDLNNIKDRKMLKKHRHCDWVGKPYGKPFYKEVDVDWRETVYNVKVERVNHPISYWNSPNFKVSFTVKLTPKEAYIVGKALKDMYCSCSYKCKG